MRVRMKALAVGLTVLVRKAQTIKRELAASQNATMARRLGKPRHLPRARLAPVATNSVLMRLP